MNRTFSFFSFLTALLIIISSCSDNKLNVNIEEHINTNVLRFDRDLMQIDTARITQGIDKLSLKYPFFFPAYAYGVLGIGTREMSDFESNLKRFVSNKITIDVSKEIQKKYNDVSDIKSEIDEALSYYHYYFPDELIPNLIFIQSGFNQRVVVDSSFVGIALDMCLGADNDFYTQLALPKYLKQNLTRELIVVDVMKAMTWSVFTFEGENNIASNMIYEGKIQYFLDAVLPNISDARKMAYSEAQIRWVVANEDKVWDAIIQEEMLYRSEQMEIKNMMSNAPFTQPFGNKSPGRIGVWLGWQIVKSYMEEHPEISVQELMLNKDYVDILNESNYTP